MTTNFLDLEGLKVLSGALAVVAARRVQNLLGSRTKLAPGPDVIQAILWIQFCCGLRISEVLRLTAGDFDFEKKILTLSRTKTGFKRVKGKRVRKPQFTSIPPDFPGWIKNWIVVLPEYLQLFPYRRELIYSYYKEAGDVAELDIGEQQEERYIEGVWTHLIRKSRAKIMIELDPNNAKIMQLVKVKLRHKFDTTERYTRPDLNALIKWESQFIGP